VEYQHTNQFSKKKRYNKKSMKKNGITECFEEVETQEEYNRYFCRILEVITITILGSMCGLRNINQIHQWAASDRISGFLKEKFGINHVPCYYWILCMLKMINKKSLIHHQCSDF